MGGVRYKIFRFDDFEGLSTALDFKLIHYPSIMFLRQAMAVTVTKISKAEVAEGKATSPNEPLFKKCREQQGYEEAPYHSTKGNQINRSLCMERPQAQFSPVLRRGACRHSRAQFQSSNQTYGAARMHAELREDYP